MVMNAFDTNFDGENEFYACNTIAHCYAKKPIRIVRNRPVRIYLVNITEFDPINSFHLHANFFNYFDTGTTLTANQLEARELIARISSRLIVNKGALKTKYARIQPLIDDLGRESEPAQ